MGPMAHLKRLILLSLKETFRVPALPRLSKIALALGFCGLLAMAGNA